MRCDEIQEGFIDLLYDETGDSQAGRELREHLRTCSNCRKELEELKKTRECLQFWKDESPLKDFTTAGLETFRPRQVSRQPWRYAAIAAMVLITLLALANTQVSLNKDGFSFSARLLPRRQVEQDYYTKAELRNIMKRALDDSEYRTNQTNFLMMQKMLDTVEQDRLLDLRFIRGHFAKNKN
jgi:hypothetical protein